MKHILALSFLVLLTACSAAPTSTSADNNSGVTPNESVVPAAESTDAVVENKAKACTCVKIYMPVCGEDKKTYGNTCEADCAGVKYTQGECKAKAKKK